MVSIPGVSPIILWAGFLALITVLLALDLGVFHRKNRQVTIKEALLWAGVWFGLAMLFNAWVYFEFGKGPALEFLTGYLIEKSLSVDNLFVFLLIFTAFGIPAQYQHRVLFWGILGAIVTRGIFIGLGTAIIVHFAWAFFLFGLILLYAAYRMLFDKERRFDPDKSWVVRLVQRVIPVSRTVSGHHFITKENGKRAITLLLLTLLVIELTDIVFAFDSIPAIFAVSSDPFIIFTSNIFAILGLRSLYFVLADMQSMFRYLKHGLAVILLFIAVKLLLKPFHYEIPIAVSLLFILAVLVASILASLRHRREEGPAPVQTRPMPSALAPQALLQAAPAGTPAPSASLVISPPVAQPTCSPPGCPAPVTRRAKLARPKSPRRKRAKALRTAKKKKR